MRIEDVVSLPARPPSEVEWEDLLMRLEVMPRALRYALEERRTGEVEAGQVLSELVTREALARRFLEAASARGAETHGDTGVPAETVDAQEDNLDRFVRFRTRNFAMVQRRGLEVWQWSERIGPERVTVYQLLTHLVREDVAVLARLRAIPTGSSRC